MKRLFDILFSLFGLIILSPILVFISISIIIDSKGGVFYKQIRVGKNNTDFYIYKFRTMSTGSDKKGLITVGNKDNRVTKIGYYLRKYKLDELAQLINVFKGDMSFVGPRPEVRKYVDMYNSEELKVLTVKPGITDIASLEYRNENEILAKCENPEATYINEIFPAKLKLNLIYIEKANFFYDIKLIFKTIAAILS